jgi:hypothetical protein
MVRRVVRRATPATLAGVAGRPILASASVTDLPPGIGTSINTPAPMTQLARTICRILLLTVIIHLLL